MMFWNRIEIYSGFSLKEFTELKDALAREGIKYDFRYKEYQKLKVQYYLYVHQRDYEHAMYLTSNRRTATIKS